MADDIVEEISEHNLNNRKDGVSQGWYLYLLECQDGSLYTGIARDVAKRFALHLSGKGARYTRSHPPESIIAQKHFPDRSSASKAEHQVKQLKPHEKRAYFLDGMTQTYDSEPC